LISETSGTILRTWQTSLLDSLQGPPTPPGKVPVVVGRTWQRGEELYGQSPPAAPQRRRVSDDEESGPMSFAYEDVDDDILRCIRLDEIARGWRGCGGL